ncbi:MAG TPA: tetratricopeptide repeat protein [Gemmatimonadales bacterium]|nr:tetratricopeptide repeat protein [Gemmatimonadales bacterium]
MKLVAATHPIIAFVGLSLLAASGHAPLPSADEIVAHYVEAIGGRARVSAVHSLLVRGTYTESGMTMNGAVLVKMRPWYKLVGDPGTTADFSEGYDGSAWEYYRDPGIVLRTVGPAFAASRHGAAIMGPLVDAESQGSTITVMGVATVGDRDAYQLRVRMLDGFEEDEFVDTTTWLLIAARKVAPIHAYGTGIASETRWTDYRPVQGVLFAFHSEEVALATGKVLNAFQTTAIEVNRVFDPAVFSPPVFPHTPLQAFLEQLFAEREDVQAVSWSDHDFRHAYPDVDADDGVQVIGYQMVKMGDTAAAIFLLERNAKAYPRSSGAAFGLGRAYQTAGRVTDARAEFARALALDPANERAKTALESLPGPRH